MAKPKLDFKKLLLERGERIGLSVAGVVTLLLLLVSLLWPGKGVFSGSPDEKARALTEPAGFINQRLSDPNNKPGEADLPPANSKDKLIALNMEPIDAEKFRMASLIPAGGAGSAGRRVPHVLGVDEAVVKLARMQIQTYMMDDKGNIYVLVGKEGSAKAGQNKGLAGMFSPKGRMGGTMGPGAMGPGSMMPKGSGAGGRGRFGLPPGAAGGGSGEEKPAKTLRAMPIEKLASSTNATPAERIRPLRMAIVAASFPYKAQIEEFRAKLALRSANEVLAENGVEKIKGRVLPSFHFTGVEAERRELDGDGNPIAKGKDGGWTKLDLQGDYQPYVILSGARFEEEDPELKAISFPGLVMPRLQGFRPESAGKGEAMGGPGGPMAKGPGVPAVPGAPVVPGRPMGKGPGEGDGKEGGDKHKDLYPPVERELAGIRKTLEALKGKSATEVLAPPSRFQGVANIFDPTAAPTDPKEKDGGDEKPTPSDGGKGDPEAREIPEHCLVRVIDTTIVPGKTYEYRIRVRMLNPNYKRVDVANPAYARDEDLPSEWSKPTPPVHVDPELRYYAVDQKAINAAEKLGKYDGPNANSVINPDRQVWLQADRWVERVSVRGAEHEVGEWAVAERFSATRGEYVGRSLRIQLPVWRFDREEFTIADDFKTRTRPGAASHPSIDVDFGFGPNGTSAQPEAIAVDFRSGKQTVEKVKTRNEEGVAEKTEKVSDEMASEVLLLDPSGRLRLLEGGLDATDKTREDRRQQARERVREIADGAKKSGDGGTGKPFGNN